MWGGGHHKLSRQTSCQNVKEHLDYHPNDNGAIHRLEDGWYRNQQIHLRKLFCFVTTNRFVLGFGINGYQTFPTDFVGNVWKCESMFAEEKFYIISECWWRLTVRNINLMRVTADEHETSSRSMIMGKGLFALYPRLRNTWTALNHHYIYTEEKVRWASMLLGELLMIIIIMNWSGLSWLLVVLIIMTVSSLDHLPRQK